HQPCSGARLPSPSWSGCWWHGVDAGFPGEGLFRLAWMEGSRAMSGIATMAVIILVAVVLFVWNRLPVVIVAMGVAVALYATGLLTIGEAFAGLGDPAVVFIPSLFIVSAGLEVTGVTAWAGQQLIAHAGRESRTRLLVFTMLLVATLTALITADGGVAA